MSPSIRPSSTGHISAAQVLALVFALNLFARGIGETFAVFLLPLVDAFDYDRAELTVIYSAYAIVLGLSAPMAGWLFDRHGPRACYLAGLMSLGVGCLLAGRAETLAALVVSAGVLVGAGGAAVGMVPATALVSRWYRTGLGGAMGIAYAGLSAGVMVFAVVADRLIAYGGFRFAWTAMGSALLVVAVLVALAPWRTIATGTAPTPGVTTGAGRGGLAAALHHSGFWALAVVFFLTSVAIYGVSVQMVAYLVSLGFSPFTSALAYGAAGAVSIVGMLASGRLSDRFGRRTTATATYLVTLAGIGLIALVSRLPTLPLVAVGALVFGLSAGSRGPIISALCARLFPGPGIAAVFGGLSIGLGLGSAAGAAMAGLLHDLTGGYDAGFAVSAAATLTAMAMFHVVPALRES